MASARPPRVLILGSGYVAITCARKMRRAMRNGEVDVTVVSRENFHCFHGSVGEMLTGLVSTGTIATPGRRLFLPARILIANITGVDLQNQQVTIRRLEDGTPSTLSYDHLVIAVGSSDNVAMYPGLKEHAHCVKTYEECFRLKSHIIQQFDKACLTVTPAERRALLTFVIAGGGYAGTEITGQLSDLIRELTRTTYNEIAASECRIILATRSKTILPELFFGKKASGYGVGHPSLVNYATDHLRGLGAEIMVETRVVRATPSHAHLSNGELIPTRTIINAVGITPVPLVAQLPVEKDEYGRIVCTTAMRVKGFDNVWSAGDCAAVPHVYGRYCPPVGTFAVEQGKHLGRNLVRAIRRQQTRPFNYVGIGQGVSIGRRNAILEVKGIKMRGLFAWIVWRMFVLYFLPTWERRLRICSDWFFSTFVYRDVTDLGIRGEKQLAAKIHVFYPGEVVATPHPENTHEHLITHGEVELLVDGTVAAQLGKGEYVSHRGRHADRQMSARAIGEVRTILVRREWKDLVEDVYDVRSLEPKSERFVKVGAH